MKCGICSVELDPVKVGQIVLCEECLKTQRPLAREWDVELRNLIKKYKDKGIYPAFMCQTFHFLFARIFDAFEEPDEVYLKTGTFSDWLNQKKR